MVILSLTYVALFVLAGLIGVGLGWSAREFLTKRLEIAFERDLRTLRRLRLQAAQRQE